MTSIPTPVAGLTTRPATGTTRYIPPHGTQYRYRGAADGAWPGCRCPECTAVHTKACKRRSLNALRGQPASYPGAPVLQHIEKLNDSGMSNFLIARQAGVSKNVVNSLVRGETKSCRRSQALRILAVQPGQFDDIGGLPADGTRRRVQALYAVGHSPRVIAAAAGLSPSFITHIANGGPLKVVAPTAAAVTKAYQQLASVPGASPSARRRAAEMGWRDPLWWEDYDHLDDPEFDPDSVEREMSRNSVGDARREEVAHLRSYGLTDEVIAARLGVSESHVRNILRELRGRGAVA